MSPVRLALLRQEWCLRAEEVYMGELLPFLLGMGGGFIVQHRTTRRVAATVLLLGAASSAINGELVDVFAPVFILIDTALALLGYTLASVVVSRWRRPASD